MAKPIKVRAGKSSFSLEGLRELDHALQELPKSTQSTVLKNALKDIAKPIAEEARRRVPVGATSKLKKSIKIIVLKRTDVGKAEFRAAKKAGASTQQAIEAMVKARRAAAGSGSVMEVAITTGTMGHAIFQEYGTAHHKAQPYMRPAFDMHKDSAMSSLKKAISNQIEKARKRLAATAERRAAKIKAGG